MLEPRREQDFALEPLGRDLDGKVRPEDLERHFAAECCLLGHKHVRHSAAKHDYLGIEHVDHRGERARQPFHVPLKRLISKGNDFLRRQPLPGPSLMVVREART